MLGCLAGGCHLVWAIIVAAGWGPPLINFIFGMHFLKPVFIVEPFAIGRAIVLVLVTVAIAYVFGSVGAVIWKRIPTR